MKVKISLMEFGDEKVFSIREIKEWFPSRKFDKRYPLEYFKKWLHVNEKYFEFLGISYKWDDENKNLIFIPGSKTGVAPLKNLYGGKVYGTIVVKPRLNWGKIYEILDLIGWQYQPKFLENEKPIFSEGILPPWFKAISTLEAIFKALNLHMRGLEKKIVSSKIPVGKVEWHEYATKKVPYGKYDQFNTSITDYSIDLEIHRQFKGIVRLISHDILNPKVPIGIKSRAKQLISNIEKQLENVEYNNPDIEKLGKVQISNFYRSVYKEAIQKCIDYLKQSKFSQDVGSFYGLPWSIEMDRLFEYWVEYWAYAFAKRIGARFYSDIKGNSKIRFYNLGNWKSLKVLKPDIIIEKDSKTLIIEVKYKKHLMYFQYGKISSETQEEHRHDLHQLLSYMSSSVNEKRTACLVFPKINTNIYDQFSTLISYTNIRANVDVVLCGVSFKPRDISASLETIWSEKYASFV